MKYYVKYDDNHTKPLTLIVNAGNPVHACVRFLQTVNLAGYCVNGNFYVSQRGFESEGCEIFHFSSIFRLIMLAREAKEKKAKKESKIKITDKFLSNYNDTGITLEPDEDYNEDYDEDYYDDTWFDPYSD